MFFAENLLRSAYEYEGVALFISAITNVFHRNKFSKNKEYRGFASRSEKIFCVSQKIVVSLCAFKKTTSLDFLQHLVFCLLPSVQFLDCFFVLVFSVLQGF
jgi:hypothetical protein